MRAAQAFLLALALGAGNFACQKCVSRQDCADGQHCEFDSGRCVDGCKGPDDCGGASVCELSSGSCVVPPIPRRPSDAGLSDTGTSTLSDAGS